MKKQNKRPEWAAQQMLTDPVWQRAAAERAAIIAVLDILEHDGKARTGLPRGAMTGASLAESDALWSRIRRVRDILQRGAASRTVYGGTLPFNDSLWERVKLAWRLARTPLFFNHVLSCLWCMVDAGFETDIRRSSGFKIELYVEPDGRCGMGSANPEQIVGAP
jgi:hypothetical protein